MPVSGDQLRAHLARFGDRPALLHPCGPQEVLTYRELLTCAEKVARELAGQRRLVHLVARTDPQFVIKYLGALLAGHVVLLTAAGQDRLVATYDPDIRIDDSVDIVRTRSRHRLHDDLTLLLSTSGSTGAAKLVRLSHKNVIANATAIAEYLELTEHDRAMLTLPLHYCYGLSVLHSHLAVGASVVLQADSVREARFWQTFTAVEATSFAGVPYTFELLSRSGFGEMELPSLRYVTQAGGRLDPVHVRSLTELGKQRGWRLFVMYGQTEATARMAYLPPHLAARRPDAIGIAIPGGELELREPDADGIGELIYHGPNVMLGYAECSKDLARGRDVHELRTGDLGRRADDGLIEVVGRLSRFIKPFGVRIDLQVVEARLLENGYRSVAVGDDAGLEVLVTPAQSTAAQPDVGRAAGLLVDLTGLPRHAISVLAAGEVPRLAAGKPDYPAVRALFNGASKVENATKIHHADSVRQLFAATLNRDAQSISEYATFASLGADSLTFVSLSVRLAELLGDLPKDWHARTIAELQHYAELHHVAGRPRRRALWQRLDTTVVLRAFAIVAIVASHANVVNLWGGAHILLAAAGYNFARLQLNCADLAAQSRRLLRSAAKLALPVVVWATGAMLLFSYYPPTTVLLVSKFVGPTGSRTAGFLWFAEVLVWLLVIVAALTRIRVLHRWHLRHPFSAAMIALAIGLLVRYDVFGMGWNSAFTLAAFWYFAAGWAAARAQTIAQRVLVTAIWLGALIGYWSDPHRALLIAVGVCVLIWLPTIVVPRVTTRVVAGVAEASLFIYVAHWQVFSVFGATWAAVPAGVLLGVAYRRVWALAETGVGRWLRHRQRGAAETPNKASTAAAIAAGAPASSPP